MHDYTAWQAHDHRMRELTRESDASRLAAMAKAGQTRRHPRGTPRRWLSFGLSRISHGLAMAAERVGSLAHAG